MRIQDSADHAALRSTCRSMQLAGWTNRRSPLRCGRPNGGGPGHVGGCVFGGRSRAGSGPRAPDRADESARSGARAGLNARGSARPAARCREACNCPAHPGRSVPGPSASRAGRRPPGSRSMVCRDGRRRGRAARRTWREAAPAPGRRIRTAPVAGTPSDRRTSGSTTVRSDPVSIRARTMLGAEAGASRAASRRCHGRPTATAWSIVGPSVPMVTVKCGIRARWGRADRSARGSGPA